MLRWSGIDLVWTLVSIAIGAYLLYRGASLLVGESQVLVRGYKVSLLAVGSTIVALGTSLPELVVGVVAGLSHQSDLVIGNVIGSDMANFGLVLGLAATMRPIGLGRKRGRVELYGLVLSSALLWLLSADGSLSRGDGVLLVALGLLFIWLSVRVGRAETTIVARVEERVGEAVSRPGRKERVLAVLGIAAGVALLAAGAEIVVSNATIVASHLGLSELFVGLTLVAVGTSLPEIVTSVTASWRRSEGIAIGNMLGSNVLNILIVLGITVTVAPTAVSAEALRYHMPILLLAAAAVTALLRTRPRLGKIAGAALIGGYLAYLAISAAWG